MAVPQTMLSSSNSANKVPVNVGKIKSYTKLNRTLVPNSTGTQYAILFTFDNGSSLEWKYTGASAQTDRDTDYTAVETAIATVL